MSNPSLIIISAYFPPDAAVGALRVGKFAEALCQQYHWDISVIRARPDSNMVEPSHQASNGPARDSQLPYDVKEVGERDYLAPIKTVRRLFPKRTTAGRAIPEASAVGSNIPEASACGSNETIPSQNSIKTARRGLLARLSDLLIVPDGRAGWIRPAAQAAIALMRANTGRPVLFSSGPPHSAHVAAARAKQRTGAPWVADLRDPWGGNPYNLTLSQLARRYNDSLEERTLSLADLIICNTDPARELVAGRLADFPADRIVTIPNGYDEVDFEEIAPFPLWEMGVAPVFLHAGSLYGKRNPRCLLEAWGRLREERSENCPRLVLLGSWDERTRREADAIVDRFQMQETVQFLPPRPRSEALNAMAAADGLVLMGDAEPNQVQIPGKLFEYLRLGKPILSLFGAGSPTEPYLRDYSTRFARATPDDPGEVYLALCALLDEMSHAQAEVTADINELSRSRQIERVHELLIGLLEPVTVPAIQVT